jgi:hypothetical protein
MALIGLEALVVLAYRQADRKTADVIDFHVGLILGGELPDDNFSSIILIERIDDDKKSPCGEEVLEKRPARAKRRMTPGLARRR